jgi:tRNA-dihydrouridine synthase B
MATITHAGYRTLVHEYGGCDLYFTEMISAEALLGGTQFEGHYRSLLPVPERTIFQIIGYTHQAIVNSASRLAAEPCAGIDINMGCSAPHLVRKGGGVAWMYNPDATARLVDGLRALIPDKSLSVKLRLGRDDDVDGLLDLARRIQASGADFITLHPKRQKEGDARIARWEYVDILSRELSIPVIGNGGIVDWTSYRSRRGSVTNPRANAFMIGRGAVRAPWLFAYLRAREAGSHKMKIDLSAVTSRFLSLLEEHQPRQFWPSRARRFYPYLFKNVRFGHTVGARLAGTHDYDDGKGLITDYFRDHPERREHVEST